MTLVALMLGWAGLAMADTRYRYATVDGRKLFYREAGDASKPTILLLHGFPSSSHMFRDLIPELEADFHVLAPDYPGMGNSEAPPEGGAALTFDAVARSIEQFVQQLGVNRAVIYMQDFGGPVGMRLAVLHPQWVRGLVIQNTPISVDGWEPSRLLAVQASVGPATAEKRKAAEARVVVATDLFLYRHGARAPDKLNPDAWTNDAFALGDPDKRRVMTDLQLDIACNLALYPQWQAYLQKNHPPTLVVWGDGDPIFVPRGADAIKVFLPTAQIQHYATGHFALEEEHGDIARRIVQAFARR
ncbi:pimeloyl-ACP methyl ester carboxylesterase [Pseudomonas sp. JUb42]|uniref:alpha/beta fold hydrolase n=1 Tax=Pseudomonas sp. JUb42 TaxID=2940611 RepID=UPI00216977A5|nr:alpha/beta hydrolase [Pseudomonas sp. JUb42]MCS3470052.1 pimeloyl-ACP methyl ester carboxylesterase [Pseudomonas sp. JUb42]